MSAHDGSAVHPHRRAPVVHDRHLGALGLMAALVALAIAIGAAFAGSPTRIASGISVDGVDVGGLTPQAAVTRLEARSARLAESPVRFVYGSQSFSLRPEELGVSPDWAGAVASAESDGNGVAILQGFRRLELELLGTDVTPAARSYSAAVDYEIGLLAAKIDVAVRQARIVRQGLTFEVQPGHDGLALDRTRAARVIVTALASLSRPGAVELPVTVEHPAVTAGELEGTRSLAELAVSAPVEVAVGGNRISVSPAELAPMLTFGNGAGRGIVLGGRVADAYFARLQALVARPAYGARFAASGSSVDLLPAQPGRALDVPLSAAAVLTASEQANDRVAHLVVDTIHVGPTTAAAKAMGITGLVGSYETVYGGVANRIHNVQLVSHLINGKLIAPGATFSFNRATGARTAAKGFLVAPVIINGELSTGLGGGVCQVSTTVFNAAFVAGLPITDRTNHALYISHYPLGRDATVDYPNVDLRFVNNTPHWLLLRTYVGPTSLTVSLFGTPQHRRVVSQTAPLTPTGPMPIAPRLDSTLAPGERVVIEPGMQPTTTSVHRWVYAPDGKLLSDSIWYSSYRAVPEVVLVGPRRPPPPPPKTTTKPSTTTPSTTTPASTTKTPTKSGAGRPVSVQERIGNQ